MLHNCGWSLVLHCKVLRFNFKNIIQILDPPMPNMRKVCNYNYAESSAKILLGGPERIYAITP